MERSAGVLLHPTSLPSRFGIGDLGPEAHRYVRWLADAGVGWWQVLPLHPTGLGHSPYSATSTYAGNPWLIGPEALVEDGLLEPADLSSAPRFPAGKVAFETVVPWKEGLLGAAFERFRERPPPDLTRAFEGFRREHEGWLGDFALFLALKRAHDGAPWLDWPRPLARRDASALADWRLAHADEVERVAFDQFLFFRQWEALRGAAREAGVRILGDVPIFVSHDSADVWAHPELFLLDEDGRPEVVAGVPPDYFSKTGQRWGNPLYDWKRAADTGYRWWIDRLRHATDLADTVRLDHFRGFLAHWEVPAEDEVATNGRWAPGPGVDLFDAVRATLEDLPFVAEDLGEITPDVIALREELGLPGMAILQFGFSPEPRSSFIPYALARDCVVYTGTHDNNTAVGWYRDEATEKERDLVRRYAATDGSEIHWDMVRLAVASGADLAVVPHQDLAGLGSEHRMNTPGLAEGNWRLRLPPRALGKRIRKRLADLIEVYGRGPAPEPEARPDRI